MGDRSGGFRREPLKTRAFAWGVDLEIEFAVSKPARLHVALRDAAISCFIHSDRSAC